MSEKKKMALLEFSGDVENEFKKMVTIFCLLGQR